MSFVREDWVTAINERRSRKVQEHRADLSRFAMGAIAMERLTGDPNWDAYLKLIEGKNERDRAHAKAIEEKLLDPSLVNSEEIMRLKIGLAEARARLAARSEVIDIPRELIETGKKSADALRVADGQS